MPGMWTVDVEGIPDEAFEAAPGTYEKFWILIFQNFLFISSII